MAKLNKIVLAYYLEVKSIYLPFIFGLFEQIVFPIPEICEYLTEDTQIKMFINAEKDDQGSKVADFFYKADDMFQEMQWQKKLRSNTSLYWVLNLMTFWSYMIFLCSFFINIIVASFYPFQAELPSKKKNLMDSANFIIFTFFGN